MAALAMVRYLPGTTVHVVRAADIPPIGVGEATTASLPPFFHDDLAIDRDEFFRAVGPSWKLGIRFLWGEPAPYEFAYPFRSTLECADLFPRSNAQQALADCSRGSLFAELMRRESSPVFRTADGMLHVEETYGYHFDTALLNAYLQRVAAARGIEITDGKLAEVVRDADGVVRELRLTDGRRVGGDLFIDSTGFASLLLGGGGEPFHSFADSLFCDRAIVGSWDRDSPSGRESIRPYTTAETMDHGWCWRIDLPHRISRGYVFSSAFCSDADAEAEMRRLNPRLTGPTRVVRFRSGRFARFWVANVAAVGNAAGFVEPLESTGLHMAMETIVALCRALIDTDREMIPAMRDVANRFIGEMWDDVRSFLAVHFRFNRRRDTPFWRHCRESVALADAGPLIEFYRAVGPTQIGHIFLPRQSVFGHRGYLALLGGQRVATDYAFTPTADEAALWNAHVARVAQAAGAALRVEDALELIVREGFGRLRR
jgi:tryptophan halogenase